jgi:two-component system CheB/CheR fusion protein
VTRDHIELKKEPIDLIRLVSEAIEGSRHLFDGRHQTLSSLLSSEPIRVMADPIRLVQILANLMSNAAKYTAEGGEVAIMVDQVEGEAKITVRDNGIGVSPELLPQLFEMFFQADTSLDRKGAGLGIGLSLTKRLVEMQRGRIEGHSEGLGKGSEFTVYLPIARQGDTQTSSPDEKPPEANEASSVHRVLIVEDSSDTAIMLEETAKSWGHEVAVAPNGAVAIELANIFLPEILLIDIGLPQMNGYELARRLRQLPAAKTACLVAITGYGQEHDRRAAHEAGFDLHLTKPVDPARLQRLLATLR